MCIARFDAEVVPGASNDLKMDLTPAEGSLVGPAPTASSETSSPAEGTRPLNSDSTIAQAPDPVNAGTAAEIPFGAAGTPAAQTAVQSAAKRLNGQNNTAPEMGRR